MIRPLRPEFDLPQPPACSAGSFLQRLRKKVLRHKMGAGTGRQKAAVFHQPHSAQINLPVSFYRVFRSGTGFGKGGGIQDDQIISLPCFFKLREQLKDIRGLITDAVLQGVPHRIFTRLLNGRF